MVELNQNELMEVNGGGATDIIKKFGPGIVKDIIVEKIIKEVIKIPKTPYERTVIRQGEKHTVKYDGKPW